MCDAKLPQDSAVMHSWDAFKKTTYFLNAKKWAANPNHVDGSLWAVFLAGFNQANLCNCENGTCESKQGRCCRLVQDIDLGKV